MGRQSSSINQIRFLDLLNKLAFRSKKTVIALYCVLLCVAPSFALLPGVLMYVSYMGELTV